MVVATMRRVMLPPLATPFTEQVGIEVPLVCGAMYPCSNPELVAAVSEAGGIGVVQPITMVFVEGRDLREGLRYIRSMTRKPIGFNAIVEKSSARYLERMRHWIDVALEEGVRFFVTALGNPRWVVDRVHAAGGVVYHDVTERKWALKAREAGVDGLVCVNRRAGGHAGSRSPEALYEELRDLDLPLLCAGGVGGPTRFVEAMHLGYAGVQMGTRFIATEECKAHDDYKRAILRARASDIVLTDKISGVPVAVIETPYVRAQGTQAGFLARRLLRHPRTKHWMRMYYTLVATWKLRQSFKRGTGYRDFFQAGQSVEDIDEVLAAGEVVRRCADALRKAWEQAAHRKAERDETSAEP